MGPILIYGVVLCLVGALLVPLVLGSQRRVEATLVVVAMVGLLVQIALTGHRWQVVPLYAVALGCSMCLARPPRWSRATRLAFTGVAVLSALAVWGFPIGEGMAPTGAFSVGTTVLHWTDESRDEWFTERKDDTRELMVQLWYPADPPQGQPPASYFDHPELRMAPLAESLGLPAFTTGHLALFRSRSFLDAPIREADEPWPVIVFSHGLRGTRAQNTSLMEMMASEGYVVAALDHAYDSFLSIYPNGRSADYRSDLPGGLSDEEWLRLRGRQLDTRVADVDFVLDQLTNLNRGHPTSRFAGRLDLQSLGIVGHSYGGATAVLAALSEPRWRAVVALDGWFVPLDLPEESAALAQPFLYMGRDRWAEWNEKRQRHYMDLLLSQSPAAFRVSLPAFTHHDFTDLPLFSPLTGLLGLTGSTEATRAVGLVNAHVLDFFNHHLRGSSLRLLSPESRHPEVRVEHSP